MVGLNATHAAPDGNPPASSLEADHAVVAALVPKMRAFPLRQTPLGLSVEIPDLQAELFIRNDSSGLPADTVRMVLGRTVAHGMGLRAMAFMRHADGRGFNPMEITRRVEKQLGARAASSMKPAVYLLMRAAAQEADRMGFDKAVFGSYVVNYAKAPAGLGLTESQADILAGRALYVPSGSMRPAVVFADRLKVEFAPAPFNTGAGR